MDDNFIIREIESNDYNHGYMDLLFEFTNYEYHMSQEHFDKYLELMKDLNKILVICDQNNKIIGSGSLFILNKIHNNPIGQIEDVIIKHKYRRNGLGKKLIEELVNIAINKYKCYKIILNCREDNINFYKKCNFSIVGFEMKLN